MIPNPLRALGPASRWPHRDRCRACSYQRGGRVEMLVAVGVVANGFFLDRILSYFEVERLAAADDRQHGHFQRVQRLPGVAVGDVGQKLQRRVRGLDAELGQTVCLIA